MIEGPKLVLEAIMNSWKAHMILLSSDRSSIRNQLTSFLIEDSLIRECSKSEMDGISRLKTAPPVIGIFEIPITRLSPPPRHSTVNQTSKNLSPWWIVADRIQDPGNLGTMIRIADWFGFEGLICSPDTVDCFNAKVIQASMGSLFRVPVHYTDLNPAALFRLTGMKVPEYSSRIREQVAHDEAQDGPWVLATMPGGMDLNRIQFPKQGGMLLVGNESQGLSQNVLDLATHRVGIPSFGSAESLNAAVATGIFANAIRQAEAIESEGS